MAETALREAQQRIAAAAVTGSVELDLSGLGLVDLPAEVWQLAQLQRLDLRDNHLTALPPAIACLQRLRELWLNDNQLKALPPAIASLTGLQGLALSANQLTALQPTIANLDKLQWLYVDSNQLTALPPEIASLVMLQELFLSDNQLTALPPAIARLENLQVLDLDHNQLTALPPEIARLGQLRELHLDHNQLTALPPEIARLGQLTVLRLDARLLPPAMQAAHEAGLPALKGYLRSLAQAEPRYEAKLILVGDGNAGKTSLLQRLKTKRFVERPTTHGIEVESIELPHADLAVESCLNLNCWDFGGQDVYRVTHQFFYSPEALYLLVWNPREKARREGLEEWLRQIRLRVGERARVLLVATHADEDRRGYRIDYTGLAERYAGMLVGQIEVDSATGTGFDRLVETISAEVCRLPHVGEPISGRWIAARDELLQRRPQVRRELWDEIAGQHGVPEDQRAAALAWLHAIGRVIHYPDDLYLREVIVTDPEWLTKAVGYLVADRYTLDQGGVLAHARLNEIWLRHGDPDGPAYTREHLPFLLRLTERFDITYRIPGHDDLSLVGELVPEAAPPAQDSDPGAESTDRQLALVCRLPDALPGLMPRLIVRTHRWTTGRHWLRGVELRHDRQQAAARLELTRPDELRLRVRAMGSPLGFFEVLRDHIDSVLADHYADIAPDYRVPCPGTDDAAPCPGLFRLASLEKARDRGKPTLECQSCLEPQEVAKLLTGFATPRDEVTAMLRDLDAKVTGLAEQAVLVRDVLRMVAELHEHVDCPRLFTLEPVDRSAWNPKRWVEQEFALTLWCEHTEHEHPWEEATFKRSLSREWLVKAAPYIRVVGTAIKYGVPLAGAGVGMMVDDALAAATRDERALADKMASLAPTDLADSDRLPHGRGRARLEREPFFEFRHLMLELAKAKAPKFGGLRRVRDTADRHLWVCPAHDAEVYNPPLAVIPPA